LLVRGRCSSPGTPASSTTKTDRNDIAENLLKVALKHKKKIKSNQINIISFSDNMDIISLNDGWRIGKGEVNDG
jgi:hypothetical protein